ncbi:hypothetical protein J5N97_024904 [Dioscorea zingiberensis]|uniref:Uncharacterized protein n=1 Tax=Dioscorea zingiberensis TaxID=325984 RepID=A0A9D5C7B2_9LILI|nr:hypothetical protein J5N97_024904 [Dioscorea zingiberensis]
MLGDRVGLIFMRQQSAASSQSHPSPTRQSSRVHDSTTPTACSPSGFFSSVVASPQHPLPVRLLASSRALRKATELVLEGVEVVPLCVLSLKIWSQHPFGQVALGAKSCYLTKFLTGVFIIVETSFSLPLLTALRALCFLG